MTDQLRGLRVAQEEQTATLAEHTAMLVEHGSRLAGIEGWVGDLPGPRYEARVQELGGRLLRNQGGMERPELANSQIRGGHGPLHDAAATAAEERRITEDQRDGLQVADFIYRAVRYGGPIYVLAEASVRLHAEDVTKARSRADTLLQMTGVKTQPVVFAESASDRAREELARDGGLIWLALPSGPTAE